MSGPRGLSCHARRASARRAAACLSHVNLPKNVRRNGRGNAPSRLASAKVRQENDTAKRTRHFFQKKSQGGGIGRGKARGRRATRRRNGRTMTGGHATPRNAGERRTHSLLYIKEYGKNERCRKEGGLLRKKSLLRNWRTVNVFALKSILKFYFINHIANN